MALTHQAKSLKEYTLPVLTKSHKLSGNIAEVGPGTQKSVYPPCLLRVR